MGRLMGFNPFNHKDFFSRTLCQDVPRKTVHQHKVEIHSLKDNEAAKAEEINKMKKEEMLGPLI